METFATIEEGFVYRAGQRTTAEGYKAADWDLNNPIWTGRVTVNGDGEFCVIRLENYNGDTFAECRFDAGAESGPTYVEKVIDSSRYFVLRIENKGRHAFIGLGFNERNSAFSFYEGITEHKKSIDRVVELERIKKEEKSKPKVDRSFKQGQTISISFKTKTKKKEGAKRKKRRNKIKVGLGNGGLLKPPPGDAPNNRKKNNSANNNLLGIDTQQSAQQTQQQQQPNQQQNLLFGNVQQQPVQQPVKQQNQNNNLLAFNAQQPPQQQQQLAPNPLFGNAVQPNYGAQPNYNVRPNYGFQQQQAYGVQQQQYQNPFQQQQPVQQQQNYNNNPLAFLNQQPVQQPAQQTPQNQQQQNQFNWFN